MSPVTRPLRLVTSGLRRLDQTPIPLAAEHAPQRRPAIAFTLMRFLSACYLCLVVSLNAIAAPVEFAFRVPAETGNPFAREVWAEVVLPHQETQIVPA